MSVLGTDLKISINVHPIGGVHLSECDFSCTFFVNPANSITLSKSEMKKVDSDTFIALVDSSLLGIGSVKMTIEIEVPDADFPDSTRTEIETLCTGITIRKKDAC